METVREIHPWLRFDPARTEEAISQGIRTAVQSTMARQGAVVAVSGGIDSSVCAALSQRALGKGKVFALMLPEADSSGASQDLGRLLCEHLEIDHVNQDIRGTLEAIGCYSERDAAIRSVFPEYGAGWRNKIVLSQSLPGMQGMNFFRLVVESPAGERQEKRLPHKAYLQLVAATNYKQRIRKTIEYYHADRLNYCVIGTPNRLEYDQGFFVKNGDGSADIKPIAHLYKTQVYAMARHLGLPEAICSTTPTTDTYSLAQGQDEFYFLLPYDKLDIVLCGFNAGRSAGEVAREVGLDTGTVEYVFADIVRKRRTTRPLHLRPILIEPVAEIR